MPHQTNRPTRPCEPATTKRRGRLACPRSLSQIRQVAAAEPLLFFGFGIDFTTVQEAALKVKEDAWMWTEAMSPGLGLHGTPASYRAGMGCVLVEPAVDDGGRTATLSDVMEVLVSQRLRPAASEPTGNCHCFAASTIAAFTAILPFPRLTAKLARLRGTDPDMLHGHRNPGKNSDDRASFVTAAETRPALVRPRLRRHRPP